MTQDRALTRGEHELVDQALVAPIAAAHMAAMSVFKRLGPTGEERFPSAWPLLGAAADETEITIALVKTLAPFVRANKDAPAEALYRQARADGVHAGAAAGFAALPIHVRLAYATFRVVLTAIDAELALERAKLPAAPRPRSRFKLDETMYAPLEERFAPASYMHSRSRVPRSSPLDEAPETAPIDVLPAAPALQKKPFGDAPGIGKGRKGKRGK